LLNITEYCRGLQKNGRGLLLISGMLWGLLRIQGILEYCWDLQWIVGDGLESKSYWGQLRFAEHYRVLQSIAEKWQGITSDLWHALRITEDPGDSWVLLRFAMDSRGWLRIKELLRTAWVCWTLQSIAEKWQGITADFWHALRITEDYKGFLGLLRSTEFLRMVERPNGRLLRIAGDSWVLLRFVKDCRGWFRNKEFLRLAEVCWTLKSIAEDCRKMTGTKCWFLACFQDYWGSRGFPKIDGVFKILEDGWGLLHITESHWGFQKKWQGISVDVWHALRITEDPEDFLRIAED
jgi:nitrogen regulatory protein PII-like uncharacterized protein